MARKCITDMPEDVKWKVVDHPNIANTESNEALEDELFTFISTAFGSGKQGKLKQSWEETFAW